MDDRDRRSERVTLPEPQHARLGRQTAFVLDVSVGGFGIAQHENSAFIGQPRKLSFEWKGRRASYLCELRWLSPHQRLGSSAYGRSIYHAGYKVVQSTPEGDSILRDILREYSARI